MRGIIALAVSAPLSIMFIVLGLPLYFKKIGRNYFYGYRISHFAMLDDDIWYAVNKQGGKHLIVIGALLAANSAFAFLFVGKTEAQAAILYVDLAITLTGVIYSIVKGIALNNRMAEEKGLKGNVQPKNIYKLD